jgi:hypothetical protein
MSDRALIDQMEDTWTNMQMVPREDRPELEESYYYLRSEWSRRKHGRYCLCNFCLEIGNL